MRLAPFLLLAACASPGTSFYGGDDTPINNGGGGSSGACSPVNVTITPVQPMIMLVVDGSGSMSQENLNGSGNSKYGAVKKALYDTNNGNVPVLASYLDNARFGATSYTTESCPKLYTTDCALDNGANIKSKIDAGGGYGGQDPLAKVFDAIANTDFAKTSTDPHRSVILVTDGVANVCGTFGQDQDDSAAAITSVQKLYNLGVSTYIIGLEPHDDLGNYTKFQQDVANAGAGGTGTTHTGDSQANLNAAYKTIIDSLIDCSFTTTETLDVNNSAKGTVMLGSTALATADWSIVDNHTFRLSQATCDMYKAAATSADTPAVTASLCTN